MSDINITIIEAEPIVFVIGEEQPINIIIEEKLSSILDSVFVPDDEDGLRIKKIYIKDGKLKIKYERSD